MKKIFLLASLFSTFYINAQSIKKYPILSFKTKVIDYGTIVQNSNGTRYFEITNTGSAPLIITSTQSSCGCSVPTPPKEPIMPNQKAKIKVTYDTNRLGTFSKSVTIFSNAKRQKTIVFIQGKVLSKKEFNKVKQI